MLQRKHGKVRAFRTKKATPSARICWVSQQHQNSKAGDSTAFALWFMSIKQLKTFPIFYTGKWLLEVMMPQCELTAHPSGKTWNKEAYEC